MKPFRKSWKENLTLALGVLMFLAVFGSALFANHLAAYDPLKVNIPEKLEPMSKRHPMGTDPWGRDIFSRILFGSRYSLVIGFASIGISFVAGGALGLIGGFYSGKRLASIILWMTDMTMAFPAIIIGALVVIILGPGVLNTIVALTIAFFPRFIRLARGVTLAVREETYILAAKSIGMSDWQLMRVHIVPNILSPLIIMGVIWTSTAITLEVSLSFLGLGVPPPAPSWGTILQDNLKFFQMEPMGVIWPCIAIGWTVQSLNLVGDRFRDILDPRMR